MDNDSLLPGQFGVFIMENVYTLELVQRQQREVRMKDRKKEGQ